jgi:ATP synthase protein I
VALRRTPSRNSWGRALDLGLQFGFSVVIGLGLGYYLDRRFGTEPVFLLIFTGLGFGAGMLALFRFAQANTPSPDKNPDDRSEFDGR